MHIHGNPIAFLGITPRILKISLLINVIIYIIPFIYYGVYFFQILILSKIIWTFGIYFWNIFF